MADAAKHAVPVSISDFKSLFSLHKTRKTVAFLYGFMLASLVVTIFFAFSPSSNSATPWLTDVFSIGTTNDNGGSDSPSDYRSQVSSIFSYLFPNGSSSTSPPSPPPPTGLGLVPNKTNSSRSDNQTRSSSNLENLGVSGAKNNASSVPSVKQEQPAANNQTVQSRSQLNQTRSSSNSDESKVSKLNQTRSSGNSEGTKVSRSNQNQTQSLSKSDESKASRSNQTVNSKPVSPKSESKTVDSPKSENKTMNPPKSENKTVNPPKSENKTVDSPKSENKTVDSPKSENKTVNSPKSENKTVNSPKSEKSSATNQTASFVDDSKKSNGTSSGGSAVQGKKVDDSLESLRKCDFFDGKWVKDDSYGLYYKPGSCSLVDEQFNCVANGRPDLDFQKFKWKPKGCSLPRLDGKKMLEMLRGKRLVFVGDSLNRNMWESLICILKNSAKDPSKVYEAHGRHTFRTEAAYSFIFKDYGCTVEFFVTPFLVQEWDVKDKNGTKKETLRLDMMCKSAVDYKTADVIVFNTGHWWTHDKTSKGEDYYQEGDKVYKEMKVLDAFRKAISTWGKWVDDNVNPKKSLVFFRGYSHSHFSGGQWNSGGACDSETVPINDEKYLRPYLPKMKILEEVLSGMKTDVTYLNITEMTDFRKDGHPSIYRKQNTPEEELKSPQKYQDCSHWCLPGVPDTWNELLYANLLLKFGHKGQPPQQQ